MRFFVIMASVVALGLGVAACYEPLNTGGRCETTIDCRDDLNFRGGTECLSSFCVCPNPEESVCCPNGDFTCNKYDFRCRPTTECIGPTPIEFVAPGGACKADEECMRPIDPRCGTAHCKEGTCAFDIAAGKAIPNQYPGDCKENRCTYNGDVEKYPDPADVPSDGSSCSYPICNGPDPYFQVFDDGLPCLGGGGICVLGKCVDCSQTLGIDKCPGSLLCDYDTCVAPSCNDGVLSGNETGTDCGGPSSASVPACRPCDVDEGCKTHADCFSNSCEGNKCQVPTHTDNRKNGDESGVDCGYIGGPDHMCKDGEGCRGDYECVSDACYQGVCQPASCLDDRMNGTETDLDCGGDTCDPCGAK